MNDGQNDHWLARRETIRWLWRGGVAVLALLVLGDVWVHGHPSFRIDGTFGFYAWFGLISCAAMVIFAKLLGAFLKRRDTYYDD